MLRRIIVRAFVLVAGLVLLVLAAPVVTLVLDEGAVPAASDAPLLPGVTVEHDEVFCGSGGCWRRLTVDLTDGQSLTDVAPSIDRTHEACHTRSLFDRRRVCIGVEGFDDDGVRLYVRFDRSGWL